jgi:hypothetical protein
VPRQLRNVPAPFMAALDKALATTSPPVRRALLAALHNLRVDFVALARQVGPAGATEAAELWLSLTQQLGKLYDSQSALMRTMVVTGEAAAAVLAVDWSLLERGFTAAAQSWLTEHGARLVTAVGWETRKAVKALVQARFTGPKALQVAARELVELPGLGLDRVQTMAFIRQAEAIRVEAAALGWSRSQVRFALEKRWQRMMYHRARRIAITEASNAANAAVDFTVREAAGRGLYPADQWELEWVARVIGSCPRCAALDGARRPLTGGYFVSRPVGGKGKGAGGIISAERPTIHPHCYCGMRTVPKEHPMRNAA